MKSEEEFLRGVYRKAEALRAQEAVMVRPASARGRFTRRPAMAAALLVVLVGGMVFFASPAQPVPEAAQNSMTAQKGIDPAAYGAESGEPVNQSQTLARLAEGADAVLLSDGVVKEGGVISVTTDRLLLDAQGALKEGGLAVLSNPSDDLLRQLGDGEVILFLTRREDGGYAVAENGAAVFSLKKDGVYTNGSFDFTREELEAAIGRPATD